MDTFAPRLLPEALVLGRQHIDAQHEALFARLIFLKDLCLRNRHLPPEEAEALLRELREHYEAEEELAAALGIDFSEHARQHEVMLLAVVKTLREVVAGRANVYGFLRYLDYWFERHIAEEDIVFDQRPAPKRPAARLPAAWECEDEAIHA